MMKIYTGMIAAFFSSIIVSITVNVLSPGDGDVSALIFLYIFPVYLFVGILLSIIIDRVWPTRKWWQTFPYYTLIGLGLSGGVVFTSSLGRGEELVVSAFIIGCAWLYFIVLTVLSYVRKMGVKG
ncbi:hypothetical protein ACJA3J_07095 [Halobacillus sp. SY10]|uniref:hypothetical protein n=1 Tax=Halobacillus sp. SY10 TaxID=3381356 RepID=UPI0038796E3D